MTQQTSSELRPWRRLTSLIGGLGPPVAEGYEHSAIQSVMPVIDYLTMDCEAKAIDVNLALEVTADTFVAALACPADRTYHVSRYHCHGATGSLRPLGLSDGTTHVHLALAGTSEVAETIDIWVPPGWSIGAFSGGNAGDSSIGWACTYRDFPAALYETVVG